jgi:hypothetical protein
MNLTVAALITNFNTWSLSHRCVEVLNRWSSHYLTKILIIDDASDGEIPSDLPDNVKVIQNLSNKGYVASVNIGFSHLDEDIVLLLDSDAYPKDEILQKTIQIFRDNPNLGALGFQLVGQNNNLTGSCKGKPTVLGLLLGQKLESILQKWLHFSRPQPLCIFSCAIAIRRLAFESINGFDEEFDFLDADNDFSIRLQKAGWGTQVDQSLILFHEGGGSEQTTAKRVLRYHKNRWRLLQKHGLINNSLTLKIGLAVRHLLEYGMLKILGKLLITDPIVLEDKLSSRQQLVRQVWSAYGNESK